jgi:hypothetical protein
MLPRPYGCVAPQNLRANRATQWLAILCCALLLCCFALMAWYAVRAKSATFDEPAGLVAAWVLVHDHDYRIDPEDPPLFKLYVAAGTRQDQMPRDHQLPQWSGMLTDLRQAVSFTRITLYQTPGTNAIDVLAAARARMIFLGLLLGAMIGWWSWRLGGPLAAVVATALFCFDPNFLAHAPLIKADVATALLLLSLMMSIWLLGERATIARMLAAALLLGALILTKSSGLLGVPILGIALLCRVLLPAPWPVLRWTARTRLARVAAGAAIGAGALLVVYLMIWGFYSFRFAPTADPDQQFDMQSVVDAGCANEFNQLHAGQDPSRQQQLDWQAQWRPPVPVRAALWANAHRFAPQAWIEGFVFLWAASFQRMTWLCGHVSTSGWWYYFPLAMAFKTPLATLVAACMALAFWSWRRGDVFVRNYWPLCCILIMPVLYMVAVIAMHLNLGLRHVLPVYPYLFIILGVTAAKLWSRRPGTTTAVVVILLGGLAAETYSAYPDFIPFFNVAAGGARGGLRLLSDSNLDWGQDLPLLAQWERQHPDDAVYLLYFGTADPACYGVQHFNMLGVRTPPPRVFPGQRTILAVSATLLQGAYGSEESHRQLEPLTRQTPLAVLGGSIYLFEMH